MLGLTLLSTPPAHAVAQEASTVVLMNESGVIANRFGSSEVVLAAGTAAGGIGMIPAIDLYVVPNQDWADADGQKLVDYSNPQHIPQTAVGFGFADLPLWFPYLWAGEWDVVVDKDQDGFFTTDRDDVIGAGAGAGFTVHFDGNRRAIDKTALKEQYAKPWAGVAAKADLLASMVTTFEILDTGTGAARWFDTVSAPFSTTAASATDVRAEMACFLADCSRVDRFLYTGLKPAKAAWQGSGLIPGIGDVCQEAADAALGAGKVSCKLPPVGFTSVGFGKQQLQLAAKNLHRAADAIYADPPDPDYQVITPYQDPVTVFQPMKDDPLLNAEAALANRMNVLAGHSVVLLRAIERFDGAVAANDDTWARKHAALIRDESAVLSELLGQVQQLSESARSAMRAANATGVLGDVTALVAEQTRVRDSGFTQAELDAYQEAGWTGDDVATLKAWYLSLDLGAASPDVATVLDEVDAVTPAAQSALWSLAGYAAGIAATPPPANQAPTASFTLAPNSGSAPLTVQVDAAASTDPDGTIAAYTWDFGDGTTASGVTGSHTFAEGTFTVALTVTDDLGSTATTTRQLTVDPPSNQAPTATFTLAPNSGSAPLTVQVDATASTDPDGTIAAYTWDFGDGTPQEAGVSASHIYASAGIFTVTLEVTDNSGARASSTKTVEVSPETPATTPSVKATVTGTLGLEDWFVSDVKVTWNVSGGGSLTTIGCEETHITQDTDGRTLNCAATNSAGSASDSVTVKRDATAPAVTWLGLIRDSASFPSDSVPDAPTCSAIDTLSGTAAGGCEVSGYSKSLGEHTLTARSADLAGNHATVQRTYFVNAVSATPGLYTLSGDFDRGVSNNVGHAIPDQLQLDEESQAFPFIWVALSGRGTIAKIDTATGQVKGEYSTTSDSDGAHNPSRTTVAADGSVWAGNRGQGSVIHVGNMEAGGCVDRNRNGKIDTSSGYGDVLPWPDYNGESTVSSAADECILHYVVTAAGDARHLSVDGNGDVWVGSYAGGSAFVLLDGRTGVVKREVTLPCGGYGGLIDGNQVLWSSGGSPLLRWDPKEDVSTAVCLSLGIYGVAFDSHNNVWASTYGGGVVYKVAPDGKTWETFPQGHSYAQGLAVDKNDHVWISSSISGGSNQITHLLNDGTLVGEVTGAGSGSTGVSVDADGKIWTANMYSSDATRIDPQAGPMSTSGVNVGAFDLTVPLEGASPYNYSDMTGSTLTGKPNAGLWTVVHDSGQADTEWGLIDWTADVPSGATLTVKVASSSDGTTFGPDVEAVDAADVAVPNGRYLRITVAFQRSPHGESPVLHDINVGTGTTDNQPPTAAAGGPYNGPEGTPIAVSGVAQDPDGGPLTSTWTAIPITADEGASCTFGDPTKASTTVSCNDDGTFTLRFTVSDGVSEVASDATLTVANVAPSVKITSPADLSLVKAGALVTINATVEDPGTNDALACTIAWGDGTSESGALQSGTCKGSHTYTTAAVHDVTVTVQDGDDGSGTDTISLVVYDQDTKVTGGGFTKTDVGRMSFGFVAKDASGVLSGHLQVRLSDKTRLHASTVTALAVSGNTATWSGTGVVDRVDGYAYTVTVTDNRSGSGKKGTPDTVSLTITDPSGTVVTSTSAPLAGGNLTVHKP